MTSNGRDELIDVIAYALRHLVQKPIRRAVGEHPQPRIAARKIVEHIELCRFRLAQLPPPPLGRGTGRFFPEE